MTLRKKLTVIIISAAIVLTGAGAGVCHMLGCFDKQTIVSRIVKTADGKGYLEVDGEPFLFGYVENWGIQQIYGDTNGRRFNTKPFEEPLPFAWMENVFEKTQYLGYKTIAPFLRWKDIEPAEQGIYDWTILNQYIDWAVKYDLRIDIVWMGTIHCGGARLAGENNGWMTWIPDYLQDKEKYFGKGIYDTDIFLAYVPDGGPNDADAEFLHQCERDAVAAMMAHLAEYDTTHRVITFQVNNEPNFSPYYRTDKAAIYNVLNELGKVVKTSDYSIMTRINLTGKAHDPNLNELEYIDCNGVDPYSYSIEDIEQIASDREGSQMPHIAENGAYYGNTSSLVIAALASGGFYSTYHLNDHFGKFGFYDGDALPYTEWQIGEIPPRRHSGFDIRNLNLSLDKIETLVCLTPAERMAGINLDTDMPLALYDDFIYFRGHKIGTKCEDGSVGLLLEADGFIYFISDTSLEVQLQTNVMPQAAERGYFDEQDRWVHETDLEPVAVDNDIFHLPAKAQTVIRFKLPQPQPIPESNLFMDTFSQDQSKWNMISGEWLDLTDNQGIEAHSAQDGLFLAIAGDASWTDFAVQGSLTVQSGQGGIGGRLDQKGNGYYLMMTGDRYQLQRKDSGQWLTLAEGSLTQDASQSTVDLAIEFSGSMLSAYIDNHRVASVADDTYPTGSIGLVCDRGSMRINRIRAARIPLLREDFAASLAAWAIDDTGNWQLASNGSQVLRQTDIKVETSVYTGDPAWQDYTVSADFRVTSGYGSLIGRKDDRGDMYILEIRNQSVKLVKWMNQQYKTLTSAEYPFKKGQWYNASLSFTGSRIEMRINGQLMGDIVYDASIEQGVIGLRTSYGAMEFDNVIVD